MQVPRRPASQPGPDRLEALARAPWPFTGRDEEFDVITAALSPNLTVLAPDAAAPAGSGVVVVAPAGGGKTRLLVEVRAWAEQQGMRTATVIATRAAARTPYGAVLHLLPADTADPGDRATWHAAFATALRSGGQPTLLVVDDAHLLDHGSATLVLQLAMEGAVTPLVAVRRGQSVLDAITALWKNSLALRVDLQPFSMNELRALIGQALGGAVSVRTLSRLAAVCDGNVLYARELVAGAIEAGSLRAREGVWVWDEQVVLAPRLVEAVGARLEVLTDLERQALAVVALGEPLPLSVAEPLVSGGTLTALEDVGLIRMSGAGGGAGVRLAHPLYGEVVLAQLGHLSRRGLLARLADALDADPRHRDESVVRVASWRLEVGESSAPETLLPAAERANLTFDHDLAERLARAGLQDVDEQEPARVALAVALAQALVGGNRHHEAHTLLVDIEDRVITSADQELQDSYLDTRFWACCLGLGHTTELNALLDRYAAPDGAGRHDPGLTAYRANLLLCEGQAAAAVTLAEPLFDADPAAVTELQRLLALETCSEALLSLGLHDRAAQVWDRLRAMAAAGGSGRVVSAAAEAELQALWAAQQDGRYTEILPKVTALHAQVENGEDRMIRGMASLALGRILLMTGQLARAHATLLDAVADFRQADSGGSLGWVLTLLCMTASQAGRIEDARRWRAEAGEQLTRGGTARHAADVVEADVWLAVAEGDTTTASSLALQGAARYPELELARARLLHLAVRVGERGPEPAVGLREIADRAECSYPALLADHVEALRSGEGRALEAVADRFAARGLDLLAAEAASHAAAAHRVAGSADGARRASARAAGLSARFDAFTTPALDEPQTVVTLSRRELDVARLAAQGMSNAAIAERLVVSVRTVESHLYQVFAKLGAQRRGDLARLLPGPQLTERPGAPAAGGVAEPAQ